LNSRCGVQAIEAGFQGKVEAAATRVKATMAEARERERDEKLPLKAALE
jgi:hypothetical protein